MVLQRLPRQTPGSIGPELGLVGPVSAHCDRVIRVSWILNVCVSVARGIFESRSVPAIQRPGVSML